MRAQGEDRGEQRRECRGGERNAGEDSVNAHSACHRRANAIEDYVHRIGRTGRAGRTGVAHSFMTVCQWTLPPCATWRCAGGLSVCLCWHVCVRVRCLCTRQRERDHMCRLPTHEITHVSAVAAARESCVRQPAACTSPGAWRRNQRDVV